MQDNTESDSILKYPRMDTSKLGIEKTNHDNNKQHYRAVINNNMVQTSRKLSETNLTNVPEVHLRKLGYGI